VVGPILTGLNRLWAELDASSRVRSELPARRLVTRWGASRPALRISRCHGQAPRLLDHPLLGWEGSDPVTYTRRVVELNEETARRGTQQHPGQPEEKSRASIETTWARTNSDQVGSHRGNPPDVISGRRPDLMIWHSGRNQKLPTIEPVTTSTLPPAQGHAYEPGNEEYDSHDPQDMECESGTCENQDQQ